MKFCPQKKYIPHLIIVIFAILLFNTTHTYSQDTTVLTGAAEPFSAEENGEQETAGVTPSKEFVRMAWEASSQGNLEFLSG